MDNLMVLNKKQETEEETDEETIEELHQTNHIFKWLYPYTQRRKFKISIYQTFVYVTVLFNRNKLKYKYNIIKL